MANTDANGITIEYEADGNPSHPPLLMIMGLGAQMTLWPDELIDALVAHGLYVIRYDNRDCGLSTKFDEKGSPRLGLAVVSSMLHLPVRSPYTLDDMADDAAGLLDALNINAAHIVGASMGGMIAQLFAAEYPARTLSLTSVMSSTGNRALPRASKAAMDVLTDRPATTDVDTLVDFSVHAARVIGSPGYPQPEERIRARARRDIERSLCPDGMKRQMAAIIANGDRRAKLKDITAPTLIIHGADDPLVPVAAGRDTAANIPGAKLDIIPGMGHNLPLELVDPIADAIAAHVHQKQSAAGATN
ncbi:MAG: alpha/beta hydrolase [Parasphingorhabdus sp.]|nr:alpha/beta hydrolase [Parasphingorhabdus sp.]